MAMTSDQTLLQRLRAQDDRAYQTLYEQYYPSVERFVSRNNGDGDQAADVFQETLLVLLTKISQPDFELTASLKTYIFSISKHLWLTQLKKNSQQTGLVGVEEATLGIYTLTIESPRTATDLVWAILDKITAQCRALLSALFRLNRGINAVIEPKHYANKHTAQNQKYKCLQQTRRISRQ